MIKNYTEWINESDGKEKLTPEQVAWCNEHIQQKWWVNDRGEVEVEKGLNVGGKLGDITEFPEFPVKFADTKDHFICIFSASLTSLEGAPSRVGGNFSCHGCTRLTSLEGAPSHIGGYFSCSNCDSLTSLKGAPFHVEGSFSCRECENLTSLEGAPSHVGGDFFYDGCPNISQEEKTFHKNTPDLFFDWLKTGLSFEEYQTKYSAKIKGNKFGL